MAQQTAVEWLEEQLTLSLGDEIKDLRGFFVMAKEMEQLQMLEEWRRGFTDAKDIALNHFDEVIKQVKSDVQSI